MSLHGATTGGLRDTICSFSLFFQRTLSYQLPGEDLDALISVTNDDDLEHMMHEYDRLCRISPKPARLRLFVFPNQNPNLNSSGHKTDKERFVDALNNMPQSSVVERIQDHQRLSIEEQEGTYTRKSDDTDKQPEKIPQVAVPGYWEDKQVPIGVYPASNINKEQVYMILAPANTQMIRPANGPPTHGY
ncbi:hypothetical protein SASPL_101202 [Salvia splendens]|uniref:PB1 domain-containing protein n=1 Tax=Salvia splendens TaxID=180675 RepID=A0A8X8YVD7_SALSN|nr:hypothetical protein SASPL_101202 [Salvia splendens]